MEYAAALRVRAWMASTLQRRGVKFIRYLHASSIRPRTERSYLPHAWRFGRQIREQEAAERIQGMLRGWIGRGIARPLLRRTFFQNPHSKRFWRSLLWEELERRRRLEELARQGAKVSVSPCRDALRRCIPVPTIGLRSCSDPNCGRNQ